MPEDRSRLVHVLKSMKVEEMQHPLFGDDVQDDSQDPENNSPRSCSDPPIKAGALPLKEAGEHADGADGVDMQSLLSSFDDILGDEMVPHAENEHKLILFRWVHTYSLLRFTGLLSRPKPVHLKSLF